MTHGERFQSLGGVLESIWQSKLERQFRALLSACRARAVALGAKEPHVYFESKIGIVVLDGPPRDENGRPQREAVLFRVPWPECKEIPTDAGVW